MAQPGPTGNTTTFNGIPIFAVSTTDNNPFLEPAPPAYANPLATTVVFLQNETAKLRSTLLEDIASSALWASESWWANGDIEKRFNYALFNYSVRAGYFATSQDSPHSARPRHYNEVDELAFRNEMARSLKHYMLIRGLPKLLTAREETRELGQKYEKTYQAIATAATVQVVTKNKWSFRTGLNPLTSRSWLAYSNAQWNFEIDSQFLYRKSAPRYSFRSELFAQRAFKRGYASEIRFRTLDRVLVSSVSKAYSARLTTFIANDAPLANADAVWSGMYSRVGLNYTF